MCLSNNINLFQQIFPIVLICEINFPTNACLICYIRGVIEQSLFNDIFLFPWYDCDASSQL